MKKTQQSYLGLIISLAFVLALTAWPIINGKATTREEVFTTRTFMPEPLPGFINSAANNPSVYSMPWRLRTISLNLFGKGEKKLLRFYLFVDVMMQFAA